MFNQILVPLDGSALATDVLPHAVAIAQALASKLTLLRLLDDHDASGAASDLVEWQLHKAEAQAYLNALGTCVDDQMARPPTLQLLEGTAPQGIINYAQTHAFDLVVLSSHLYGGLNGWYVSRVVQQVLDRLRKSILLVRAGQPPPAHAQGNGDAFRYRRILAPLDGSPRAEAVLPLVTALAHYYEAELMLVHVLNQPELSRRMPQVAGDTASAMKSNRFRAIQSFATLQTRFPLVSHLNIQASSNVAAMLHSLVDQADADLVVLSAQGAANQQQWSYGSIVASFLSYGTTPLLIMQDLLPAENWRLEAAHLSATVQNRPLIHKNFAAELSS